MPAIAFWGQLPTSKVGWKNGPKPKQYFRFAAEIDVVKHAWRYTLGEQQFRRTGGGGEESDGNVVAGLLERLLTRSIM
jgi:hypothetical protein